MSALPELIGVIHLPALAGAPGAPPAPDALSRAGLWAVREAKLLEQAGFQAIIVENFGDAPFYAGPCRRRPWLRWRSSARRCARR